MRLIRHFALIVTLLSVAVLTIPQIAYADPCISSARLKELRSGQWVPYAFYHLGQKHSGKTKYLPNGQVHAVSRGKTYNRGTWKLRNGFVVRYAPDRPGKKRYKLRIEDPC